MPQVIVRDISNAKRTGTMSEETHAVNELVFNDADVEADCPMKGGRWQRAKECRSCPHLDCVGAVQTAGKDVAPERRYRIMCKWGMPRKLKPSKGLQQVPVEVQGAIAIGAGRTLEPVEQKLFMEEAREVWCPITNHHTGKGLTECPTCPACSKYRGVAHREQKQVEESTNAQTEFFALCSYTHSVPLRRRLNPLTAAEWVAQQG